MLLKHLSIYIFISAIFFFLSLLKAVVWLTILEYLLLCLFAAIYNFYLTRSFVISAYFSRNWNSIASQNRSIHLVICWSSIPLLISIVLLSSLTNWPLNIKHWQWLSSRPIIVTLSCQGLNLFRSFVVLSQINSNTGRHVGCQSL